MNTKTIIIASIFILIISLFVFSKPLSLVSAATAYQNRWTWEGETSEHVNSWGSEEISYFPSSEIVPICKTAILSEVSSKLITELAKIDITAVVTLIDNIEVHIESTRTGYVAPPIGGAWLWENSLHMTATIYFTTDKPLLSPISFAIDPVTLAALVIVIKYLILVIATALVIYGVATTFVQSFLVQTHVIETYDPTTGKWTRETIVQPSISGQLAIIVMVIAVIVGVLFFYGSRKIIKKK